MRQDQDEAKGRASNSSLSWFGDPREIDSHRENRAGRASGLPFPLKAVFARKREFIVVRPKIWDERGF